MAVQHQIKRTLCEAAALDWVRALLENERTLHRTGVADRACEHFGLRDPRGRFQRTVLCVQEART